MSFYRDYCSAALALAAIVMMSACAQTASVRVDAEKSQFTVSDKVVGIHFVYSSEKDEIHADGSFANWAKDAGIGYARYPGGTVVKYWNWEKPTGVLELDNWAGDCDASDWDQSDGDPASDWMSLDEFFEFVDASGVVPTFGANLLTGVENDCQQAGIDRAVRMVEYVKSKGYAGADWYLGNEEQHRHGGAQQYARNFAEYARAMKKADPNIKVFWNHNNSTVSSVQTFLSHDGGMADGLETHGKWPYGGKPNLLPGTLEEWRAEYPIRDRKNGDVENGGRAWRFAADTYRKAALEADTGSRELLISNNEYGLGIQGNAVGFNRYQKGLLMTDVLAEHIIGNWYSTSFWSNILTNEGWNLYGDERGLLSIAGTDSNGKKSYRRNPFSIGMKLLASAQGGAFIDDFHIHNSVYGFAVRKAVPNSSDAVSFFTINKSLTPEVVEFSAKNFPDVNHVSAHSMVRAKDGYGELQEQSVQIIDRNGETRFIVTLSPESYTKISLINN